ncbi:hypothetical protein [Aurantiacibacter hainanensis]|uniref:hypothetical protein n=1 Tax=Aurantiacibacter hainanensis TaxID=3076114 RepID=UPI0030C74ABA
MTETETETTDPTQEVRTLADQFAQTGRVDKTAIAALDLSDPEIYRRVRTSIVRPLMEEGRDRDAAEVLALLVESPATNRKDRIVHARLVWEFDRDAARPLLDDLIRNHEDDPAGISMALVRLLKAKEFTAAADYAEGYRDWPEDGRLTTQALKALIRDNRTESAFALLEARGDKNDMAQLEQWLRLLNRREMFDKVVEMAPALDDPEADSAGVHIEVGDALLSLARREEAVERYGRALEIDADSARALTRRGETLLTMNDYRAARIDLARALELAPHLNHLRVWLGRALKGAGEYDRAADLMVEACLNEPESETLRRDAASALNQAGRQEAAMRLYDHLLKTRDAGLPSDFASGLQALWQKVDDLDISKARFDWAWQFRDAERFPDREEWERRGKWGLLADRLIYDWLECRMEEAGQVLEKVCELDPLQQLVQPLVDQGRGVIFASAHIGAMFTGPLALELLGFENRWMASTPGLPSVTFNRQLISTSDQTEAQVARQAVRALASGATLTIAVDGRMSTGAPRIAFEGQEITYSAFAARLAYKQKAPSVFAVPQWRDGTIHFHLAKLPYPREGEPLEEFTARWREAYLAQLRIVLSAEPENLRLAGGIWRHIVPQGS